MADEVALERSYETGQNAFAYRELSQSLGWRIARQSLSPVAHLFCSNIHAKHDETADVAAASL